MNALSARVARQGSVAVAAACILAGLITAPAPAESSAAVRITQLGRAPAGYTFGPPSVLATSTGVTLVAWRQYGQTPNALRLMRSTGAGGFTSVPIRSDGLKTFGDPYLMEDPVKNRLLLTATAQADGATRLGTYVWTSPTNGASWSLPIEVWDSFGTGQSTMDGHGGFYTIVDTVGAAITHVPASLTMQHFPDNENVLTDKLGGRAVIGVATLGRSDQLLFGFASRRADMFVHVSDVPGRDRDNFVTGRLMIGDTQFRLTGGLDYSLLARMVEIDKTGKVFLEARTLRLTSTEGDLRWSVGLFVTKDVPVSFAVYPLLGAAGRPTGEFRAVWFDDRDRLRTAVSQGKAEDPWTASKTLVQFPTASYSFPNQPAVGQSWAVVHAYDKDLREVILAIPVG